MSEKTNDRTLRIAFVEYDLRLGGGLTFVLDLAAELMRRGVKCHVFSVFARSSMTDEFARLQIPISFGGEDKYSVFEDRLSRLLRAMQVFAPTTVVIGSHTQTCELLRYIPSSLQRIVVFHLVLRSHLELARTYREYFEWAVGVSERTTQILQEIIGLEPPFVRCIELGIERPLKERQPGEAAAALRILYLGRLEQEAKRVRLFPGILQQLQAAGIPFRWTIAGEGGERSFLEAQMPSESNAEVVFKGLVPRRDISALLAEHDVFLLTSDTESYPLGLHEAMAAGLVPVTSAIPGRICEIVTPATGCLVAPDDVAGYARAIITLNGDRASLASKCLQAQRMIGAECTVAAMGDRWMMLLGKASRTPTPPTWSEKWAIEAPLGFAHSYRFSMVGRWMRRLNAIARRCFH